MVEDRTQLLPGGPPLTALAQRSEPEAGHLVPESGQYRQIPRYRMVLVVTAQYAPQPFSDLRNRRVHSPAEFLLQFLQFLPPSFAVRNASDFEPAQPVLPADMLESQEGERLRFSLSTLGPVERCEPPESDQPCLVFIQLQPILPQMLLQFSEVALCLVLVLEAEDGIVGVAHDGDLAPRRLPPPISPLIEHIMQVHVTEQRRNDGLNAKDNMGRAGTSVPAEVPEAAAATHSERVRKSVSESSVGW